jgi:1-acyl-sn-glycerol-3-phosphate acyltransferase
MILLIDPVARSWRGGGETNPSGHRKREVTVNRDPLQQTPPRWSPKMWPWLVRRTRLIRRRWLARRCGLQRVDVQGLEHLRGALAGGCGVLVTPNHSAHCDAAVLYEASDQLRQPFHFMACYQVFTLNNRIMRQFLRWHGVFSVDREGTDLHAFREGVEILRQGPSPLVIYPEGEIYHTNDRVTPFRAGAAAIALSAAKNPVRPIVCVPCAMKFWYVEDPTPALLALMDQLERRLFWTARPELPLVERIYRLAEGMLALKELEHRGATSAGTLPDRVAALIETILQRVQGRAKVTSGGAVPERVKALRHQALQHLAEAAGDADRLPHLQNLDDLFSVVQLFSYPGDYVAKYPSVERIAETLDKFEEDVLQAAQPALRGRRNVCVCFGEPLPVERVPGGRDAVAGLTDALEARVQLLLDQINADLMKSKDAHGFPGSADAADQARMRASGGS